MPMSAEVREDTPERRSILGLWVDATSYEEATARIVGWARAGETRRVCAADVHMVMEGVDHPSFREMVNEADLVTPDGMPLVWGLRWLGARGASQVCGPCLTVSVCAAAQKHDIPIALYGGTPESLADFRAFLARHLPSLRVVCSVSPPFRPLTPEEDEEYTRRMVGSGARIVLVGIGCPKQERWMSQHLARIPAVMIGVGAAFDFHSGRVKRAPRAMQRAGLEWLFRLAMEPRRLWRRYLVSNPRFLVYFGAQLARFKLTGRGEQQPAPGRTA